MNNPFLHTLQSRLLYIGIWVMVIIAQILLSVYYWGERIPIQQILSDTLICNSLQVLCLLALWYPVQYYRNIVNVPLFLLFHLSLLLISLTIWLGLGFLINRYIVIPYYPFYTIYFLMLLPVRIIAGLLIYIIFVLVYYLFLSTSEINAQKEVIEETKNDSAPIEKLTRISVKKHQEIHFVPVNRIMYFEANGDYVLIHTDESKYLKDRTMKYWETHLPDDLFVRIHRSFIINIEWIAKIELYEKETYKVQLKNGNSLKASSAGYKLLKQKMQL
jgi:hypothetical protein